MRSPRSEHVPRISQALVNDSRAANLKPTLSTGKFVVGALGPSVACSSMWRNGGNALAAVAQVESGDKNRFHCEGVDKLTDNRPARSLCYCASG